MKLKLLVKRLEEYASHKVSLMKLRLIDSMNFIHFIYLKLAKMC
jgi:hypothetical protein